MMRLRHKLLLQAFRISDQAIMVGTLIALVTLIHENGHLYWLSDIPVSVQSPLNAFGAMMMVLGWTFIFNYIVRYDANRFTSLAASIKSLALAITLCTFMLFMVGKALGVSMLSNNRIILLFWPIALLMAIASRIVLGLMLMKLRRSGLNCRHIALVGDNARTIAFAKRIEARPELGYRIAGFITESEKPPGETVGDHPAWSVGSSLAHFKEFLEKGTVDEVMVGLSMKDNFAQIYEIIRMCRDLGVVVRLLPDLDDVQTFAGTQIEFFEGDCVVTFFRENLLWQLLVKRAMDLSISLVMLVILIPFLLGIALLVKFTSPGPVFFIQERMGMNRRKFRLFKFRSMINDAEARKQELAALNERDGPAFKIRNDPRITPIGRWLRKTSIDELPQLLNVLRGEMSLVGPRPPLPTEVDQYEWVYRRRLSIKPGLTCLWQVSGRHNIPFARWMELDREYIDKWSIWLDLKILLKTIPVVLFQKGAS